MLHGNASGLAAVVAADRADVGVGVDSVAGVTVSSTVHAGADLSQRSSQSSACSAVATPACTHEVQARIFTAESKAEGCRDLDGCREDIRPCLGARTLCTLHFAPSCCLLSCQCVTGIAWSSHIGLVSASLPVSLTPALHNMPVFTGRLAWRRLLARPKLPSTPAQAPTGCKLRCQQWFERLRPPSFALGSPGIWPHHGNAMGMCQCFGVQRMAF